MVGLAYGTDEHDDPSEWTHIDLGAILGPAEDGCPPRVNLFVKRFESSSPDFEDFLHDPLRNMLIHPGDIKAKVDGWPDFPGDDDTDPRNNIAGGALQAIRDDPRWAVHTNVTNHHRKLSKIHVIAMAGFPDPPSPGSITVTLHKDASLDPPH